jgi:putative ABC transport system permease protein
MLESLLEDLRHALRGLRREPLMAVIATATLAVAIGASTTVFSLVNSILIRPLLYPGSDRIYWISEHFGPSQDEAVVVDYYSLRAENRVFEDVGAYDTQPVNWTGVERPQALDAAEVSVSFFHVMGAQPALGRVLAAGEEGHSAPAVAVLSYSFWRNQLGGDPKIAGKTIGLDGMPYDVIGVMPQGFDFPRGTQIWKPLPTDASTQGVRSVRQPMRRVALLGRRKAEVGPREMAAEMSRLTATIRAAYPPEFEKYGVLKDLNFTATPLQRLITGDVRPALLMLSGAVGLVLLIACVNLANLLLARASARPREMAVRLALGSSRARVLQQTLTEAVVWALPGGVAGVAIAWLSVRVLNAVKPTLLARYPPIAVDLTVLAFSLGLTLATGIVFGMAPALAAAGTRIQETLKSAGYSQSRGPRAARFRRLLVVVELSVSLVLLIGAGLLARSFLNLAHTQLGFPAERLLTFRVRLTPSRYRTAEGQAQYFRDVLERVKRIPAVRNVALTSSIPLSNDFRGGFRFQAEGRAPLPLVDQPETDSISVSPDFFQTMGIHVRSGQGCGAGSPARVEFLVNEAFARRFFPGEDPVGRILLVQEKLRWTVIGVVGDIRSVALGAAPEPVAYRCVRDAGADMGVVLESTGDPRDAVAIVEQQVHAVDPDQPIVA